LRDLATNLQDYEKKRQWMIVCVEVKQFQQEHGRWPESLEELDRLEATNPADAKTTRAFTYQIESPELVYVMRRDLTPMTSNTPFDTYVQHGTAAKIQANPE
jgi:hypothetical protein